MLLSVKGLFHKRWFFAICVCYIIIFSSADFKYKKQIPKTAHLEITPFLVGEVKMTPRQQCRPMKPCGEWPFHLPWGSGGRVVSKVS